jgi:hypothetical protein
MMKNNEQGGDALAALPFREILLADFEFRQQMGDPPSPVCLVARELRSGREIILWRDELIALRAAPFDTGKDSLFVAYAAAAELACMAALGWQAPLNVIDLFFEHRRETNGLLLPNGNGLLGALAYRGVPHIDHEHKEAMRQLIIGQNEWSDEERKAIIDYCRSDVDALAALFEAMAP